MEHPKNANVNNDKNILAWFRNKIRTLFEWVRIYQVAFFFFLIAILVYTRCFWYQSGAVERDAGLFYHYVLPIDSAALNLDIIYPQRLPADKTQAIPLIIGIQHTLPMTATRAHTLSIQFSSPEVIVTNTAGERITNRWIVTPTALADAMVTVNVRRVLSSTAESIVTPTLTFDALEHPLPPIILTSLRASRLARLGDLVWGSTTPLIPFAAGLIALAWKTVQKQEDEKRKREDEEKKEKQAAEEKQKQQEAEAKQQAEQHQREMESLQGELSSWEELLKTNLSEGARQYVQLRQHQEGLWKPGELGQQELQRIWEQHPPLLRDAVEGLEFGKPPDNFVEALKWAYEHLDEAWRVKAFSKLLNQGHAGTEEQVFYNMLRVWPQSSFGRKLQGDSFYSEHSLTALTTIGERDGLWFQSGGIQVDWLKKIRCTHPVWAYGLPGCGKTTAALWLLRETARHDSGEFNVYCPLTQVVGISNLENVARAVAHTLLYYFALDGTAFLKMDWRTQHILTQFWHQYAGPDVRAAFYTAGLSPYGEGQRLLERVNALLKDVSLAPLPLIHLPGRLADVCPPNFTRLTVLLDVQAGPNTLTESMQDALLQLGEALHQAGIGVKILTSGDSLDVELPRWWHRVKLAWTEADLHALLVTLKIESIENSESHHEKTDSIDSWWDYDIIASQAKSRLLAAAQGTPRGLLQKLIELQQRKETTNSARLSTEDLDDILGPAPAEEETSNA